MGMENFSGENRRDKGGIESAFGRLTSEHLAFNNQANQSAFFTSTDNQGKSLFQFSISVYISKVGDVYLYLRKMIS